MRIRTPVRITNENAFTCESCDGALAIPHGGQRVADCVYRNAKIPRPYFENLCAPDKEMDLAAAYRDSLGAMPSQPE